jgi:hypothetical protein
MPANAYRIVWADDLNVSNQAALHVNFNLSNNGGTIALLAPDGRVVDRVIYGPQANDISQGRSPNGGAYIFSFSTPTPGTPNPSMQAPPLRTFATIINNQLVIGFNTQPGLTYRVEYKNTLNAASWTQLAPAQVATGNTLSFTDSLMGNKQRFYRAVIVP